MAYWLVKSDPDTYSWQDFKKDKSTIWDGVRNYQARNYLLEMKNDDHVLFYHSGRDKAVMGVARISKENFPDPSDTDWIAVELSFVEDFNNPVTLERIKKSPYLKNIALVRQSRLSVMQLTDSEYNTITILGQ